MIELFRSIASVFLPENISIEKDIVTVSFFGEIKWTQNLAKLTGFAYHSHNQFTGGKMLIIVTSDYVSHDYFGQNIGFKALLDNVLERSELSKEKLQSFSKTGYPPDGFIWQKQFS